MAKHGGAWKVAYADFITAMMALFMVLWILGTEEELLQQFQEYFRNPPSPFDRQFGKFPVDLGEFSGHSSESQKMAFFDRVDPTALQNIVREFNRILNMETDKEIAPPVEVSITADGLRIIIFDREDSPVFEDGVAELTPWGNFVIQNLAWLLSRYSFKVMIDGHSGELDERFAGQFTDSWGPWELSVDRANSIRRRLQFYSSGDVEIFRVTGYGNGAPLEGAGLGRTHQRVTLSLSLEQDLPPPGQVNEF